MQDPLTAQEPWGAGPPDHPGMPEGASDKAGFPSIRSRWTRIHGWAGPERGGDLILLRLDLLAPVGTGDTGDAPSPGTQLVPPDH